MLRICINMLSRMWRLSNHWRTYAQSDIDQFESQFIADLKKLQKGGWPCNKSVANDKSLVEKLTDFQDKHGNNIVQTWKNLFPKLMTKYHDGYTAMNLTSPRIVMKRNGYPKWWVCLWVFVLLMMPSWTCLFIMCYSQNIFFSLDFAGGLRQLVYTMVRIPLLWAQMWSSSSLTQVHMSRLLATIFLFLKRLWCLAACVWSLECF